MRGKNKAPPAYPEAPSERPSRGRVGWEGIYGERPHHGSSRSRPRGTPGVGGPPFPSWVTGARANHAQQGDPGPQRDAVAAAYSGPAVLSPVVEASTWRNAAGDSRNDAIPDKQAAKRRKVG